MSGPPSPFDLTGRTAVVTGGARGLGRGITEGLLRAGAEVVVLQRSEPPADLVSEAAGRLYAYAADLSDQSGLDDVAAAVLAEHRVDILVNNAGIQFRSPAEEFPLDRFDEVLAVNLRAVFALSQAFGRGMLERASGKIVNVASLLSFQGGITVPAYAASKGAVAQLTKALCNEWAGRGVNVNAVAPGYMDTELNTALLADPARSEAISSRIPAGRWGTPADIAGAVVYLSSPAADYVHGVILPVDGGWLAR
jgi:2-deoxy-D-gluconate 3-dehydrogenase